MLSYLPYVPITHGLRGRHRHPSPQRSAVLRCHRRRGDHPDVDVWPDATAAAGGEMRASGRCDRQCADLVFPSVRHRNRVVRQGPAVPRRRLGPVVVPAMSDGRWVQGQAAVGGWWSSSSSAHDVSVRRRRGSDTSRADARWRLGGCGLEWQHGDMRGTEESPAVAGDSLEHPQQDSNPCRHLESDPWADFYGW